MGIAKLDIHDRELSADSTLKLLSPPERIDSKHEAVWDNPHFQVRVHFWTMTEWDHLADEERPANVQRLGPGWASLILDRV